MKTALMMLKCMSACGVCFLVVSCAGVTSGIRASHIDQPVSFTPCVYDAHVAVIKVAAQDVVKHFKIQKRFWAMFWGTVNLTHNDWDLSDELNRELAGVNGDAIVNMTVVSRGDWLWLFSTLLPIIPDYHTIIVEGDIARVPSGKAAP